MNTIAKTWKSVAAGIILAPRAGGAYVGLDGGEEVVERVAEALAKAYAQGAEQNLAKELARGVRQRIDMISREADRAQRLVADFLLYAELHDRADELASSRARETVPLETMARDGAALIDAIETAKTSVESSDVAATFASLKEARDKAVQLERELERARAANEVTKADLVKTVKVLLDCENDRLEARNEATLNAEAYEALRGEFMAQEPIVTAARGLVSAIRDCRDVPAAHEELLRAVVGESAVAS